MRATSLGPLLQPPNIHTCTKLLCRVPSVPGSGQHVEDADSMAAHCQLSDSMLDCHAGHIARAP